MNIFEVALEGILKERALTVEERVAIAASLRTSIAVQKVLKLAETIVEDIY